MNYCTREELLETQHNRRDAVAGALWPPPAEADGRYVQAIAGRH